MMSIAQSLLAAPPPDLYSATSGKRKDARSRNKFPTPAAGSGPSLHVILDSPVQSGVPVLRAVCSTRDPVLLVALERDPEVYLLSSRTEDAKAKDVISDTLWGNPYCASPDSDNAWTINSLLARIRSGLQRIRQAKPGSRCTVVFDSLHPILDTPNQGVSEAIRLIRGVLGLLWEPCQNPLTNAPQVTEGRIVTSLTPDSDLSSRSGKLVGQLQSASLWAGLSPPSTGSDTTKGTADSSRNISTSQAGSTCISHILPVQFARVLQEDFAQRLPLTPSSGSLKGNQSQAPSESSEPPDPRVWPLVSALTSRGVLGRPDQPGWWYSLPPHSRPILESVRPSAASSSNSNSSDSTANSSGVVGLLVSYAHSPQGKVQEEIVGLSFVPPKPGTGDGLAIVPLTSEVVDELQPPAPETSSSLAALTASPRNSGNGPVGGGPSPAAESGDAHSAMLAGLPFNLTETSAQRAQRAQVVLPHQAAQHEAQGYSGPSPSPSNQGRGSIVFHPEAVDDADEEELDDDEEA